MWGSEASGTHGIFLIISRSAVLRMRIKSDKSCREYQNAHFMPRFFFFRKPCRYEIKCKNTVQPSRPQMTIRRKRIAWWILRTTNTHSSYVILTVFLLQQWLHERTSTLRHMYFSCFVTCAFTAREESNVFICSSQLSFVTRD